MGRYIDWDDVINRYPALESLGGADELNANHIVYSEAYVDGCLSDRVTPPFSSNNLTVKDLCIDFCYWRAARFKLEDAVEVKSSYFETLEMIKKGQINMVDSAGNVLDVGEKALGFYSNTGSYHSAFGIDDPIDYSIDPYYIEDTEDSRL